MRELVTIAALVLGAVGTVSAQDSAMLGGAAAALGGAGVADATGGPDFVFRYLALRSAGDLVTTNDAFNFTNVPGMSASIRTGAGACVVATFSAEIGREPDDLDPGGAALLQALLDGSLMEGHREGLAFVWQSVEKATYTLATHTFWRCGVAAGPHTVAIRWVTAAGHTVAMRARTLIIAGR